MVLTFCSASFAGPGHSHGHSHGRPALNKMQAKELGQSHVKKLVEAKKVDSTWVDAIFDKSEMKKFGKKKEWVVTFKNEKGVRGKKLFIFLRSSGEFVAANFTGK